MRAASVSLGSVLERRGYASSLREFKFGEGTVSPVNSSLE